MKLSDFDFELPPELIARFPAERRDDSRLLYLQRASGRISHHRFGDLPRLVADNDFLVMNNSRVVSARLLGQVGGRAAEMLVVKELVGGLLEALCRPAARFTRGAWFVVEGGAKGEVVDVLDHGRRRLRFDRDCARVLEHGYAPLPPYIKRRGGEAKERRRYDLERYQTVYARDPGSIAAPTAGLHFTPEILARLGESHPLLEITLEVGEATFQKIETEDITRHQMGSERIRISAATARRIHELRSGGGRLLAVGTTTVRSLESYARLDEPREEFSSDIFIRPGFSFRMVDKLLTNFHLPRSSLFVLTSAFAGLDVLREAYQQAIAGKYRFFSYGDAMLIA